MAFRRTTLPFPITRRTVLAKGIHNLRMARRRLVGNARRQISGLAVRQGQLLRQKRLSAEKTEQLRAITRGIRASRRRISQIEAKAAFLLDPRMNQLELELQADPDFSDVLHHRAFSELMHARLLIKGNHIIGMIDADRLKEINSRFHSHWFGNEVLKMFSGSLAEMCRAKGIYYLDSFGAANTTIGCKYGGDEFMFYLPLHASKARESMDLFRQILQKRIAANAEFLQRTGLSPREAARTVTFSGGVIAFRGAIRTRNGYAELFHRISSMTLGAKEAGRNRVQFRTITTQ